MDELSSTFELLSLEMMIKSNLKLTKRRCSDFLCNFKSDIGDQMLETMGK